MEVTNISNVNYGDKSIEYANKTQNVSPEVNNRKARQAQAPGLFNSSILKGDSKGVEDMPESVSKAIISEINKKINRNTTAQFSYHEKTNRVMIKIMDSETNEVIKEIPPEKTLDMIAKILELVGLLVDDKR